MRFTMNCFLFVILLIVMSVIIGLAIVNIIDRKISNVSINVPPIKVPDITLNISQDKNGKFEMQHLHFNSNDTSNKEKEDDKIVEGFRQCCNRDQYITGFKNPREKLKSINRELVKRSRLKSNSEKNIYMGEVPDKRIPQMDRKIRAVKRNRDNGELMVQCQNPYIKQQYKSGKKKIRPNKVMCDQSGPIQPWEYYEKFKYNIVPLEDYPVMGSNYQSYTNSVRPSEIGRKILPRNSEKMYPLRSLLPAIPDAHNYAFHDSPAMKKQYFYPSS